MHDGCYCRRVDYGCCGDGRCGYGKLYADINLSRSDWPDGQNPFRKPMFIIMNLALGGYGNKVVDEDTKDEKSGKVIPAAKFPMGMKIDWVRYYRR